MVPNFDLLLARWNKLKQPTQTDKQALHIHIMPFGAPKCPKCNKAVYFAERQNVLGKDWHKTCVKCQECAKKLEPGSLSDNNGKIYCKCCYGKVTGMKGYGYGGSGGSLASYESYGKGDSELIGGDVEKSMEPSARSGNFDVSASAASNDYFCSQCGFKLAKGSKFCSQCGGQQ